MIVVFINAVLSILILNSFERDLYKYRCVFIEFLRGLDLNISGKGKDGRFVMLCNLSAASRVFVDYHTPTKYLQSRLG